MPDPVNIRRRRLIQITAAGSLAQAQPNTANVRSEISRPDAAFDEIKQIKVGVTRP